MDEMDEKMHKGNFCEWFNHEERERREIVITFQFVSATVAVVVCYLSLVGLVLGILGRICNITVLGLGKTTWNMHHL